MAIKNIINKFKSVIAKSDESPVYVAKIKEVKPIDNVVDDFLDVVDGGAVNE